MTHEHISERSPKLSIVIPVYNEETNIAKLYEELNHVLTLLDMSWEIIFADDGSTDNSWEQIVSLHKKEKRVKAIRLSRNFGHQYALFAGLSHAFGKVVISMDADLQHPPQLIPKLIKRWHEGYKIIHTIRLEPDDFSFFKKITSRLFYRIFSFCGGVQIEPGMADFRLLDREVLDRILQFREAGLFLRGIVQWVGYPSTTVTFQAANRFSGVSHYSFFKMLRLGWDGISSFSIIPLRFATLVGFLTSGIAFSGIVYAFYAKFVSGSAIPGWASSVAILSFLLGVLFILIGLIGEYIGRILIEVMQRPRYLLWEKIGIDSEPGAGEKYMEHSGFSVGPK